MCVYRSLELCIYRLDIGAQQYCVFVVALNL